MRSFVTKVVIDALTAVMLPWLLLVSRVRRKEGRRRKILIIQLGKIGDMVCVTPLLRSLRTWDASAEITVFGPGGTADILAGNPCVDRFINSQNLSFAGLGGRLRLLLSLHRARFGVSIAVHPGAWNAVLGLWTSAPVRVHTRGGRLGLVGSFFHPFHTHRLVYGRGMRTYDHFMNIAQAVGAPVVPYRHEMFLSDAARRGGMQWLERHGVPEGSRVAVLSLTAGNKIKEWPLERFVEVAKHLTEKHGMHVLLSSSDTAVTSRAWGMLAPSRTVDAGGLPLRLLAAVIARASLFISVDTGPLYIAHAFGVPLVDIVGPVHPAEQPPPPSPRVALVLPPLPCKPCSFVAETLRVSTEEQRRCLDLTTVNMVIEAADGLLRSVAA